jgi:hypothetical protein
LKGVNPDVAMKYLTKKKAAYLSGVEKESTWVHSNYNEGKHLCSKQLRDIGQVVYKLPNTTNRGSDWVPALQCIRSTMC